MSLKELTLVTSEQFNFRATVLSHGWYMLAPFSWDDDSETLEYVYQTADGSIQRLLMRAAASGVRVQLPDWQTDSSSLEKEVIAAVARMLNIDWDLREFYAAMRNHDGYAWLEAERHGRILTCPSLWEDLAKVLLTTNCNWAQTINMTGQLCQLGEAHPTLPDHCAFPSPQRIAALPYAEFAEAVRAGYRSAYLHELAQRIASADIDIDSWRALDSDSLYQAVKALKGFGDYAAGTIVRMLGHFDKLAIDSACHAMFAQRHNKGQKASGHEIRSHYSKYGRWRGLVMWMDIMRRLEA